MPIIGLIVGALVALWIDDTFESALAGAFIGLIAGLIVKQWRDRKAPPSASAATTAMPSAGAAPAAMPDARLDTIEARLARLESALERAGIALVPVGAMPLPAMPISVPAAPVAPTAEPAAPAAPAPVVTVNADGTVAAPPTAGLASALDEAPPMPAYNVREPARPNAVWAWITGGNTLARVGILVLFIGLGFLLKYASEHMTVPIELRIAAVALGGIALLVLGWRLRERREGYAMILQGGGVGVLYLTVFAALKLYALLPPLAAFALLFLIAGLSSWLAVRQNSIALAAVGVIGGFLAPVLTSRGEGNHVLLFSYYALLNAGIFAIAWFKAWRLLNLLGFACTFIIGTLWGITRYRPENFATTEPFLVLFFLYYVAIAVLYALRRSVEVRNYVDGTLVFGTPLVAAGLQHALVRDFEFGMAFSAVAAAALYLVLARWLWARRRDDLRLLVESFLALGVAFATLAVPFAFDARWTSATWALEGAAIVWIGARQQRMAARVFGLLLQLAAAVSFWLGWMSWGGRAPSWPLPILNSECIGAVLIAVSALVSAWMLQHYAHALRNFELKLAPVVFAWGVVWWLVAGVREIDRWIADPSELAAIVAFLAASALAFALVARRFSWRLARAPAYVFMPLLLAIAIAGALRGTQGWHLFQHGGAYAWVFALATWAWLLRELDRLESDKPGEWVIRLAHAGWVWLIAVLAAHEISWAATAFVNARGAWRLVPWGLVPALALLAIGALSGRTSWPVGVHRRAYLVDAATPLVVWMLVWSVGSNIVSDGNAAPLPYVPLLNPLDLTLALVTATIAMWYLRLGREGFEWPTTLPREVLIGVPAAILFVWVNAIVLRTIHHFAGVPWSFDALWRSMVVQSALSLLWTVVAMAAMVLSNRHGARAGWVAGAALLAVVVVKLFAVDLSRVGGVERIVSFIGVGVLLLAIGYLAPFPPRREEEAT